MTFSELLRQMSKEQLVTEVERMHAALECFEHEIERRSAQLSAPKGGMRVPDTGDFVSVGPSALGRLRWHLQNIRGWK